MNSIEQEAIRLRQEHTDISTQLDEKRAIARDRLSKPTKLRSTAGFIAGSLVPAKHAMTANMTAMVGPKMTHDILQLDKAHEANSETAQAHYEANTDEYHQMAITDTPADITPVEFSGDVAVNVEAARAPRPHVPAAPEQ